MEQMIKSLEKENILEAVRIFEEEPILNYQTESPVLRLNYFEFSNKTNKNPVFLRILLNYISLINVLYDKKFLKFHEILLKFHAKFTYEELENQNIKLILLVKSNAAVYNMIFKEGVNIFPNRNDIDINFWNKNEEDIGYTFQELGRIFINDYVIGRDKGIELPNMVFYLRSIGEIHKLIGKLFIIPFQLKLDLNENREHCGVNEYDHVIEMTQDLTIDKNNPYFRYIKNAEGFNVQYEFLTLEKNKIYFLEFKHSYQRKDEKNRMENLGHLYLRLYNINIAGEKNQTIFGEFRILYFYNYFENLGYRNFDQLSSSLNLQLWRFLYLRPSCQIVPVVRLSSEVSKLKKIL